MREMVQKIREYIKQSPIYDRVLNYRAGGPKFTSRFGRVPQDEADVTFVVICGGEFEQAKPNAATTSRMGWCHGFEELGIPFVLISVFELAMELPKIKNPICWIAGSDYVYLDGRNLKCLRKCRHAVLVSTHFDGDDRYFQERGYPRQSYHKRLRRKILSSEPKFLFTMSSASKFEFYEGWWREGARVESLPLACDSYLYSRPLESCEFGLVELAFVGGYWSYKARQFDTFLRPLSDRLTVYGYSPWPYGRFGGLLSEEMEAPLYRKAKACPVINEPHVSELGIDINERVFKVLGSGGLGITDVTPAYLDWFSPNELLVPASEDEYFQMIQHALASPEAFGDVRNMGRQAVLGRHTYRHRALEFARLMGLTVLGNRDGAQERC